MIYYQAQADAGNIGRRAITVLVFNTTLQFLEILSFTPFQALGSQSLVEVR